MQPVHHVFAYGSLMYAPVWRRVVSGEYVAVQAALHGFQRRRISHELFPGLVRAPAGHVVRGVLYLNVSTEDLAALDHFEAEGEAYERIEVQVTTDDGARHSAWTFLYVIPGNFEEGEWDPACFEAEHLPLFLATYYEEHKPR